MRLAVIGAGAWGTALAHIFGQKGHSVSLWGRSDPRALRETRRHPSLSDVTLHANVHPTDDFKSAVAGAEAVLIVTPVSSVRSIAESLARAVPESTPIILCSKGVDEDGWFVDEIIGQAAPDHSTMILSGPNFAGEVARGLPTATVLAGSDANVLTDMANLLATTHFRIYPSADIAGVATTGAAKNVIAIAAGVADGIGLGENARAAIVSRGVAEIARLCTAREGDLETVIGLAGVGDLTLTCAPTSRNFSYGRALGTSNPPNADLAEGARACRPLVDRAFRLGVEMPLSEAVCAVVEGRMSVLEAMDRLLRRPPSRFPV